MDVNAIIKANLDFYDSIKPKNQTNDTYTVLATINDSSTGKLLALATGTQANTKVYPQDIEDCHAESLVKRAFKRHLIESIICLMGGNDDMSVESIKELIKKECTRDLILFISQFPCGLIKRYEGQDPMDPTTGQVIKRKPGRGTMKDGEIIYVQKDTCLDKLRRWTASGLQGKRINQLFDGLRLTFSRVVVGDCEPDISLDYEKHRNEMASQLGHGVPIELLEGSIRRDELVFYPGKLAQPVDVVWWASSCRLHADDPRETHHQDRQKRARKDVKSVEFLVDGRRRGLTKKQLDSQRSSDQLKISNHCLRSDLSRIEQLMRR